MTLHFVRWGQWLSSSSLHFSSSSSRIFQPPPARYVHLYHLRWSHGLFLAVTAFAILSVGVPLIAQYRVLGLLPLCVHSQHLCAFWRSVFLASNGNGFSLFPFRQLSIYSQVSPKSQSCFPFSWLPLFSLGSILVESLSSLGLFFLINEMTFTFSSSPKLWIYKQGLEKV